MKRAVALIRQVFLGHQTGLGMGSQTAVGSPHLPFVTILFSGCGVVLYSWGLRYWDGPCPAEYGGKLCRRGVIYANGCGGISHVTLPSIPQIMVSPKGI